MFIDDKYASLLSGILVNRQFQIRDEIAALKKDPTIAIELYETDDIDAIIDGLKEEKDKDIEDILEACSDVMKQQHSMDDVINMIAAANIPYTLNENGEPICKREDLKKYFDEHDL